MQPNICAIQKVKGDMAQSQPSRRDPEPPPRRNDLPPEILEIIWPALQVGGLSGMSLNPIYYFELYRDTILSSIHI
jgi:hypothetical protein